MRFKCIIFAILSTFTILAAEKPQGRLAVKMAEMGLVNIHDISPEIIVDLMYARDDNFTGQAMYRDLRQAYLRPEAAKAVGRAQAELSRSHPGYRLKIHDASRPMSVQRKMYNTVRGTSKARYVSNPRNGGGLHNYGMAVDISIVDDKGVELPMGTKVDHLGIEANIDREKTLVKNGKITEHERKNRLLLRREMTMAGFKPLRSEWWHFNLCTRAYARTHLPLIDF